MLGIGCSGPGGSNGGGVIRGKERGKGRRRYREIEGNGEGNQIHGIRTSNLNKIK